MYLQAHIFNILKSKLTTYQDFDTMLYTCAREFDFLGWEMPTKTTLTLLLPSSILAGILLVYQLFSNLSHRYVTIFFYEKSPKNQLQNIQTFTRTARLVGLFFHIPWGNKSARSFLQKKSALFSVKALDQLHTAKLIRIWNSFCDIQCNEKCSMKCIFSWNQIRHELQFDDFFSCRKL